LRKTHQDTHHGQIRQQAVGQRGDRPRTFAFHFEKPDGFEFTSGKSINLFLPEDFPGVSDDRQRAFSLVNAPHEDRLTIATRMRKSAYKQPLKEAAPGAAVRIVGPTGSMSLHDEPDRAIVMIAGGIGITPFMSMLRSEAQADRPRPMVLLYSNSRPENAAYLDELRELEQRLDGFRLVLTMTEMKDSDSWRGETRRIDADMVKEATSGLPRPHYYVAGAPDMAEDMRQMLDDMGIDDDDIHSEDFTGYT
jgi:ferredoxin-NADP reductase